MRVGLLLGMLAIGCAAVRSPAGADPARQSAAPAGQSAPKRESPPRAARSCIPSTRL